MFCPQAVGVRTRWEERIRGLREDRTVRDLSMCPDPLRQPATEVLFSSNVLLTVPPGGVQPSELGLREEIRQGIAHALTEDQAYWYDHPVQIGTAPEKNEILHGLKGLSDALAFEKKRGAAHPDDRLEVALSVSVTHPSLHGLARAYIEEEVLKEKRNQGPRPVCLHGRRHRPSRGGFPLSVQRAIRVGGYRTRPLLRRLRRGRPIRETLQLPEGRSGPLAGREEPGHPGHLQDRPRPGISSGRTRGHDGCECLRTALHAPVGRPGQGRAGPTRLAGDDRRRAGQSGRHPQGAVHARRDPPRGAVDARPVGLRQPGSPGPVHGGGDDGPLWRVRPSTERLNA